MKFQKKISRLEASNYFNLAKSKEEKKDFVGALGLYFTALKYGRSFEIYKSLARCYSALNDVDASNKYYFKYLSICPKSEKDSGYEGLAINFMKKNDFLLADYYLGCVKKYSDLDFNDEYIQKLNFINEDKKPELYYVVYPEDKKNYQELQEVANGYLAIKNYKTALSIYERVPVKFLKDSSVEGMCLIYLYEEQIDKAIDLCREVLKTDKNNFSCLCNLSTFYNSKGNHDKARYYYDLAKERYSGSVGNSYRIIDCAILYKEHEFISSCLKEVVKCYPDDYLCLFYYALALANIKDYLNAYDNMVRLCKIYPDEEIYSFLASYLKKLCETGNDEDNLLPFEYSKSLPKNIAIKRSKKVDELMGNFERVNVQKHRKSNLQLLKWALTQEDEETANKALIVLVFSNSLACRKVLLESLIEPSVNSIIRQKIIYSLITFGYRGKMDILAGNIYVRVKAFSLPFEGLKSGTVYVQAFAHALSKLVYWNFADVDKLVKVIHGLYNRLENMQDSKPTHTEIACLSMYKIMNKVLNLDTICAIAQANKKEILKLIELLDGE